MLYAILCYHSEATVCAWSREEDQAVMERISVVKTKLSAEGKLGPNLRLLPTTAAVTLRKSVEPPLVIDGPFAETKEQLLGLYILEVASLDEALDAARELGKANPGGSYEIRPIGYYDAAAPGGARGAPATASAAP